MPKSVNRGVRELARLAGCSPALVTRKRKQGKSDEQIIAEATSRKQGEQSASPLSSKPVESFADAQARKEVALANLRELEEGEKRKSLLPAEEVRDAVNGMVMAARSKLLVIGDELADKLAATSDPVKCREMVDSRISVALASLADAA